MRQMQLDALCSFWVFVDATNSAAALESISGETQQTANICHFCHKCTTWFSLFIHFLCSASKFLVDCQSLKYSEGKNHLNRNQCLGIKLEMAVFWKGWRCASDESGNSVDSDIWYCMVLSSTQDYGWCSFILDHYVKYKGKVQRQFLARTFDFRVLLAQKTNFKFFALFGDITHSKGPRLTWEVGTWLITHGSSKGLVYLAGRSDCAKQMINSSS